MQPFHTLALLRVDDAGRITAVSREAERWLGCAVGRSCRRVVAATCAAAGVPICREGCASALAQGAHESGTSELQARVRGQNCRLACRKLGNGVVVLLEPQPVRESPDAQLSPREREVLALVALGLTGAQVAARLGLRPSTVRTHMEHARERLGARSRAEAVARWLADDPDARRAIDTADARGRSRCSDSMAPTDPHRGRTSP